MRYPGIHQACSITYQGFWNGFSEINPAESKGGFKAKNPDYKTLIPAMTLRRMAPITKMALMCGLTLSQVESNWDGIILGTGLGNLSDTEKFLHQINQPSSGLIPPTSFTQSSHNTLAGQLALQLKNHAYNMTYVHRSFAFEHALQDAFLQFQIGKNNVLVGAADERISLLDELVPIFLNKEKEPFQLGEGASIFHLSSQANSPLRLLAVQVLENAGETGDEMKSYLEKYGIDPQTCVLIPTCSPEELDLTTSISDLTGSYMSNSAFAFHWACNKLIQKKEGYAVIVNNNQKGKLGLTLISHV